MDFRATKTPLEREDEETERLVRPSPKYKPPRHDKRRERMEPEDDPDLERQASMKARLVAAAKDRIPARNRETGQVVQISPDTLKEKPGQYEPVDEAEEGKKEEGEEKPSGTRTKEGPGQSAQEQFYQKAGDALREMAKQDKGLQSKLKSFVTPGEFMHGMVKENPDFPASKILHGVELPEGIRTIKDVQEAWRSKASPKPKTPKQKKPKKTPEPVAEEPGEPTEAPKPDAPEAVPEGQPEAPPLESPPEPGSKPEAPEETTPEDASEPAPEDKPKGKGKGRGKKKPKDEEKPAEEAPKPEPTELEKAGIPAPKRREPSALERQEAMTLLANVFPPETAAELIASNIHPDDVNTLVRTYSTAKAGADVRNIKDFAGRVSTFYETNPAKVQPPKQWQGRSFDELEPDEKAEAARQHVLKTVALSLAATDALTKKLSNRGGLSGRARIPDDAARMLARTMLINPPAELSNRFADEVFSTTLHSGKAHKFSDGVIKTLLSQVKGNPVAEKMARAYFQAGDYQKAKDDFLGSGALSEWDSPGAIVSSLKKASQFFRKRSALYGDDLQPHPAMNLFRTRVMSRLKTLSPDRHRVVQQKLSAIDHAEYQDLHKKWAVKFRAWKQQRKAYQQALKAYQANPQGRKPPKFKLPKPVKPQKPITSVNPQEGKDLWGEALSQKPPKPKKLKKPAQKKAPEPAVEEAQVKTANFTYPTAPVMGSSEKTSVYHGVDPYAHGPEAYPGWLQPHQRDLGEADFEALMSEAREWLKSDLLSVAVNGMELDARIRAALDLAIYSGPYNRGINPTDYNRLLAGLGAPSTKNATDTSTFSSTSTGGDPLKVSKQIRQFAAKVADVNSKLAYEMLDFADRVAEQQESKPPKSEPVEEKKEASTDKYTTLRTTIIKHAASLDPAKRASLLPILQTLKDLG